VTFRTVGAADRAIAALWGASALGALLLRPVLEVVSPFLPRCLWHAVTGFACPTCGTTRAALALLGGDPLGAFVWNPLTSLAGAAFLAGGVVVPVWVIAKAPVPVLSRVPYLRLAAALALLLNWAYLVWAGI
jgi:hypothetical protein